MMQARPIDLSQSSEAPFMEQDGVFASGHCRLRLFDISRDRDCAWL
jgi:hypothetical protein